MPVNSVLTEGWTRGSVEATIRLVTQQQREALAERVRAEMERRGWNNPKLAREAELSEKTISRVINARKDSRLDTIERIAKAFGVPECDLRGPPPPPLGLGASDGQPTQLDRIEARVDEILRLLKGGDEATTEVEEELVGRLPDELSRADGEPKPRAPARSGKTPAASRRTRASS